MLNRVAAIAGATLFLALIAGSAMAGTQPPTGRLPEPATMTLFGLAVAGAFIARKFVNRK